MSMGARNVSATPILVQISCNLYLGAELLCQCANNQPCEQRSPAANLRTPPLECRDPHQTDGVSDTQKGALCQLFFHLGKEVSVSGVVLLQQDLSTNKKKAINSHIQNWDWIMFCEQFHHLAPNLGPACVLQLWTLNASAVHCGLTSIKFRNRSSTVGTLDLWVFHP